MGDIVVNGHAGGFTPAFENYTPIVNYAGIYASIMSVQSSLQAYLSSLDLAAASAFASTIKPPKHVPPAGYHFGAMDPSGEHYMIKDGDAKNTPVITPWYSAQIQDNVNAFNKSTADLSLGLLGVGFLPGAGPFVSFVGGVMTILSWGAAHSDPATSPIFP